MREHATSAALRIVAPGMLTTVQDLGRRGHQRFGVSPSGATDGMSLAIANCLVGNPPGEAGLEMTLQGATIEVETPSLRLAFAGDFELAIDGAPASPWRSHRLRRGQRLAVGRCRFGLRGYLAIAGGLALAPELGSLATHLRAALGGLDGRELAADDRLPIRLSEAPAGGERALLPEDVPVRSERLRVVLGPQDNYFAAEAIALFLAGSYEVTAAADRMGIRLDGPRIAHAGGFDVISDAVVTGSVQVPGAGQPIIMLADRQTTGGYPKIATVIGPDLPHAAQARPGAKLAFAAVTLAEAQDLRAGRRRWLAALPRRLVPVAGAGALASDYLLARNLISGVADAHAEG